MRFRKRRLVRQTRNPRVFLIVLVVLAAVDLFISGGRELSVEELNHMAAKNPAIALYYIIAYIFWNLSNFYFITILLMLFNVKTR